MEDCALARACIRASEDPINGAEQKGAAFFEKIWTEFKDLKPGNMSARPLESSRTRFKAIVKNCVQFSAFHASIVCSKPPGISEEYIVLMATALFNDKKIKDPTEDVGKPFTFLHDWQILRNHQKYMSGDSSQESNGGGATVDTLGDQDQNGDKQDDSKEMYRKPSSGRATGKPMRRLQAAEQLQRAHATEKRSNLHRRPLVSRKREKTLARHREIMIFTQAPSECNAEQAVDYFNIRRTEALENSREKAFFALCQTCISCCCRYGEP